MLQSNLPANQFARLRSLEKQNNNKIKIWLWQRLFKGFRFSDPSQKIENLILYIFHSEKKQIQNVKIWQNWLFSPKMKFFWAKKWKIQKSKPNKFFWPFWTTTWPSLKFLALFFLDFYSKTWNCLNRDLKFKLLKNPYFLVLYPLKNLKFSNVNKS